jgi:hypothetical protein
MKLLFTKKCFSVMQGSVPKEGTLVATHSGVRGRCVVTHS